MSIDLTLFTSERPDLAAALARTLPEGLRVECDPAVADAPSIAIAAVSRRGETQLCTVDGPLRAEDEDAPEEVAAVLLAVRWTVQISMPAGLTARQRRMVVTLARALADDGRGIVFDPQENAIAWPRNPRRLRAIEPVDADAHDGDARRHVELEFVFPRLLVPADAKQLLAVLRQTLPEAVPTRFGDYEPPQGRLDRDGDDAFAAFWEGDSDLFWRGTRPFEWGYALLQRGWGSALSPAERDARTPLLGGRKASKCDRPSLEFDAAVGLDPAWASALDVLFRRMCEELQPFFAAAFHTPGPGDDHVVLHGRYWLGIPPSRFWLVYAGPPYAQRLPDDLPRAERVGDGVLVTLADRPTDWAAIDRNRIAWPPELMRTGTQLDDDLAAAVIPPLGEG